MEKLHPGHTRDDAWFAERTFNGFNPALPCRTDEEDVYAVRYDWADFDSDGVHDLPRIEARFRKGPDAFEPLAIDIELRKPEQTLKTVSEFGPKRTYRPGDAEWAEAKRVFRSA